MVKNNKNLYIILTNINKNVKYNTINIHKIINLKI